MRLENQLAAVKPASLGQAARIAGVSPADISVLLVVLKGDQKHVSAWLDGLRYNYCWCRTCRDVEAGLAAARMGQKVLLLTISLDNLALMACNPSIGDRQKLT